MKKYLMAIIAVFLSYQTGYAALSNQDNRIDVAAVINIIENFEKNTASAETVAVRKNILHELSVYTKHKTPEMKKNETAFIFHMIKNDIGQDKFNRGLNKISDLKNMPNVTWLQLLRSFPDINAEAVYEAYFMKNPLINFTVKDVSYSTEQGELFILFTLIRKNGGDIVKAPYMLEYDNHRELGILQSGLNREETFRVPVKPGGVKLSIDPYYSILRELSENEKTPVIADILNADNITFVNNTNDPEVNEAIGGITSFKTGDELTFGEIKNNNMIINDYNNYAAAFFADKKPSSPAASDYFVFANPQNPSKYIMIMNNYKSSNLKQLYKYAMNQELSFKDGKLLKKYTPASDNGITVYKKNNDIAVNTRQTVGINDIVRIAAAYPVVFIGEHHNNYAHHINQLEIIKGLASSGKPIAIGMEMVLNKHNGILNDFINGRISEKEMLEKTEYFKNWKFDYNLYAPIFRYARDNKIDIIGLNIDGDITGKIYAGAIDNMTDEERKELPKAMNTLNDIYSAEIAEIFSMHKNSDKRFENFYLAQNVWDEIMAKHIADYKIANPNKQVVVISGGGHAGKNTGIPLRYKRITGEDSLVILQDEPADKAKSDFVIETNGITSRGTPAIGISISTDKPDIDKVKIKSVEKGSPAEQAGLREGDIISKCGYHDITDIGALKYALFEKGYGSIIECTIIRGKTSIKKNIKLFEYNNTVSMDSVLRHMESKK